MSDAQLTPNQVIDVYEQRAELTATLEHAIKTKQMRPYLRTFTNRQLQAVCRGAKLPPKSRKEANVDQLAELVENNKVKVLRVLKLVSQGSIFVLTGLYMAGVLQFPAGTKPTSSGHRVPSKSPASGTYDVLLMIMVFGIFTLSLYSSLPSIHKSFKRLRGKRRAKTIKALHKQIQRLEFVRRSRSRSRSRASSSSSRASSSASSRASSAPRTRRRR